MASTATATDSYPSPVTPRDSESEGSQASGSMAGRKRRASEMADDSGRKPFKQGPLGMTAPMGYQPTSPPRLPKNKKKKGRMTVEQQDTIEAENKGEIIFTVECPVWPDSKRYQGRLSRENLYTEHDAPALPEVSNLGVYFSVKPGTEWSALRRFKNAKFKDPVEVIYSAGQIVYVNRHWPIPPAPSADASEDEKLAFDRENFWVALIAEFRAASQEKVYVRVFWLYWPEELPMGRQAYHGKRELVMSNHVDIIEAQSIACHTNISHWDENDDSNKVVLSERFWRQTYDLTKMVTTSQHALGKLRKFCICGGYDNPELDMYQCHKVGCGMWNHQACLIATIEERAWESFKKGQLTHEVEGEHKSFTQKVADTVGHIVDKSLGKTEVKQETIEIKDEAHSDNVSMDSEKVKLVAAGKRPWSGKLEGTITTVQRFPDEIIQRATVKQLVPASNSKPRSPFKPKTWNMELQCLRCQHPLN